VFYADEKFMSFSRASFLAIVIFLGFHPPESSANCNDNFVSFVAKQFSLGKLGSTKYSTLILLGAPASGKGTLSDQLLKEASFDRVSVGAVLREHIAKKTQIGVTVEPIMAQGGLVPEEILRKVLSERLQTAALDKPLLFDGSPRRLEEAKFLIAELEKNQRNPILVLWMEAPDEVLIKRAVSRNRGPDDQPQVVKERLKVYYEETLPVAKYMENLPNVRFVRINANQNADGVYQNSVKIITVSNE
jgi:adenylate kinase